MKNIDEIHERIADVADIIKAHIQSSLSNVQRLLPELEILEIKVNLINSVIPGISSVNVESVTLIYEVNSKTTYLW